MGMYDNVHFINSGLITPACAAGHVFEDVELQTKDFDCNLDTYYVFTGTLYCEKGGMRSELVRPVAREADDKALVTTWQTRGPLVPFTGSIHAYTHCRMCLPVLEHRPMHWNDGIVEHKPWCEYLVAFRDGRLTAVDKVRVESRDDVRKTIEAWGRSLPDTDHVAQKHFERLAAYRKHGR